MCHSNAYTHAHINVHALFFGYLIFVCVRGCCSSIHSWLVWKWLKVECAKAQQRKDAKRTTHLKNTRNFYKKKNNKVTMCLRCWYCCCFMVCDESAVTHSVFPINSICVALENISCFLLRLCCYCYGCFDNRSRNERVRKLSVS